MFVGMRYLQQELFPPGSSGELKANRKIGGSKSARDRDCGNSPDIEGAGVAEHEEFDCAQVFGVRFEIGDLGWGDGDRGR